MNKKKILFVIYPYTESGGHHYTTLAYVEFAKSLGYDCEILNIGHDSYALDESKNKVNKFKIDNPFILFFSLYKIRKISRKFSIIHCMDRISYMTIMSSCLFSKKNIIFTKCGGAVRNDLPYCESMIFFSKREFDFYSKKFYKDKKDHFLIPNRVFESAIKSNRKLNIFVPNDLIKVGVIARITPEKKKQFLTAKALYDFLTVNNISCQLFIIGGIQKGELCFFDELKLELPEKTIFLTDPYHINKSSDFIDEFDVMLVMGRGVMEAAYAKKVVVLPDSESGFVLLDKESFPYAVNDNFSARAKYPVAIKEKSKINLINILRKEDCHERYKLEILKIYDKYFNLNSKIKEFCYLYEKDIKFISKSFFLCLLCFFIMRTFRSALLTIIGEKCLKKMVLVKKKMFILMI